MKATKVLVVKTITVSPAGIMRLLLDEEITRVIELGCLNVVAVKPQEQEVVIVTGKQQVDRKSTRLNSSHSAKSRMPSSA